MSELISVGTHLVSRRTGYLHHGLYTGCGMVIHYAGLSDGLRVGPVEEISLEQFANGRGFTSVDTPKALYRGSDAVYRARQRLGEGRYNLLTNNCEHFVHWCLYDTPHSEQVNTALKTAFSVIASRYGGSLLLGASAPATVAVVSGLAIGYGVHRYLGTASTK